MSGYLYRLPKHLLRPTLPQDETFASHHLVRKLNAILCPKLISLIAPTGYGKAVIASEFIKGLNLPFAWCDFEHTAFHKETNFILNLIESICYDLPTFGNKSYYELLINFINRGQLTDSHEWILNNIIPAFIGELEALHSPLWIVLNHYHHLRSKSNSEFKEIDNLIENLIQIAPSNIHFLITTEKSLHWRQIPHWKSAKLLFEFGVNDIEFNFEESLQLAKLNGINFNYEQIHQIHQIIGGWPLLHGLLYTNPRLRDPQLIVVSLKRLDRTDSIKDFLLHDILERQPEQIQNFLIYTSDINELDIDLCNQLLNITNSQDILDNLTNNWFLVSKMDDAGNVYYFHRHEITRSFLKKIADEKFDASYRFTFYTKLGKLYQERRYFDLAILNYKKVDNYDCIIQIILNESENLIIRSETPKLWKWLISIPEPLRNTHPMLLIYYGLALTYKALSQLSEDPNVIFQKAIKLFESQCNPDGVKLAKIEYAYVLYNNGSFNLAHKILIETQLEDAEPSTLKAKYYHHLSLVLFGLDEYPQALKQADYAINLYKTLGIKVAQARVMRHKSLALNKLGCFWESATLQEEALAFIQNGNYGDWIIAWHEYDLARTYQQIGCFDLQDQHLCAAEAIVEKHPISQLHDYIKCNRADYLQSQENFSEAAILCKHTLNYQSQNIWEKDDYLLLIASNPQCKWEDYKKIQTYTSALDNSDSLGDIAHHYAICGIAALTVNQWNDAESYLTEANKVFKSKYFRSQLNSLHIYIAKLFFLKNNLKNAKIHLQLALDYMQSALIVNLEYWQPKIMAEMFAKAIELNIQLSYVEHIIHQRGLIKYFDIFYPLLNDPNNDVWSCAKRILADKKDLIEYKAREILREECDDPQILKRFKYWLDIGWLTHLGLLRLYHLINAWRQLEIFLIWLQPEIQGGLKEIHLAMKNKGEFIAQSTVKDHLDKAREKIQERANIKLEGKGSHSVALIWCIQNNFIKPSIIQKI